VTVVALPPFKVLFDVDSDKVAALMLFVNIFFWSTTNGRIKATKRTRSNRRTVDADVLVPALPRRWDIFAGD